MCPAIKHLDAVVGDDMRHCIVGDLRDWRRRLSCANNTGGIGTVQSGLVVDVELGKGRGGIGTVIAELRHGELAESLFVFVGEVLTELNQCLVGHWLDAPRVACGGEYAGCFKHDERQIAYGTVGKWITSLDRDALDFTQAFLQCFNGVIWGPYTGDAGTVGLQGAAGDGSIVGV